MLKGSPGVEWIPEWKFMTMDYILAGKGDKGSGSKTEARVAIIHIGVINKD